VCAAHLNKKVIKMENRKVKEVLSVELVTMLRGRYKETDQEYRNIYTCM
jgi:hypothetical protein